MKKYLVILIFLFLNSLSFGEENTDFSLELSPSIRQSVEQNKQTKTSEPQIQEIQPQAEIEEINPEPKLEEVASQNTSDSDKKKKTNKEKKNKKDKKKKGLRPSF